MPCTYYTADEERQLTRGESEATKRKLRKVTKELNTATRLLCGVIRTVSPGVINAQSTVAFRGELTAWWAAHEERDNRRLAKEAEKEERKREKRRATARKRRLKESAIAKLSDAEKEALGL